MPTPKTSLRAEQEQVRARMRALGLDYGEVAAEFARRYRLRPRAAYRHAYGWTLNQAAGQVNTYAAQAGLDPGGKASMTASHLCEYEQWPAGSGRKPSPQVLALLAHVYNTGLHNLLDLDDYEHLTPADRLLLDKAPRTDASRRALPRPPEPVSPGGRPVPVVPVVPPAHDHHDAPAPTTPTEHRPRATTGPHADEIPPAASLPLGEDMAVAAEESVRFLQATECTNIGAHTVEQFHADIRRIVAVYSQQPSTPTFLEVRGLRNQAFALLGGRQQPRHTRDLYYVAGLLGGILANAAFDLGSVSAAETHARTAFLCAEFAGHNGLKAWVRGTQSMLAYWDDRPGDAVALAQSGWEHVPERGTARVRLAALEARALARVKDTQGTRAALAKADRAREQVAADDDPGGMLAFPMAKQLYYTSSCALWLGGKGKYRAAERDATHAITLFEALPDGHRRLGEQCLAHVDLALARLRQGDLDGAAAGVRVVLDMSTRRRVESAMRRLRHVADILGGPAYRAHRPARELREKIIDFPGAPAGSMRAIPAPGTTDTAERPD